MPARASVPPPDLERLLVYGSASTRRRLAQRLSRTEWSLLIATVRSTDTWRLRARCLEVLGTLAGGADQCTAEAILRELLAPSA